MQDILNLSLSWKYVCSARKPTIQKCWVFSRSNQWWRFGSHCARHWFQKQRGEVSNLDNLGEDERRPFQTYFCKLWGKKILINRRELVYFYILPEGAGLQLTIFHHWPIFQLPKVSYTVRNNEGARKSNHPFFQRDINSSTIGFAFSFNILEFLAINNLIL